mmetsp:Transcript_98304/g.306102  ORF Transcript_98304/g.306102 Transcript_98304/m.306102 type:complete len:207 (-) Transcript_98304:53-673(-)
MTSFKEQVVDWAIESSRHGTRWWMPFLLMGVSCINSLTSGMFVWCIGVLQAVLFTIVSMSNKVGLLLGPLCLTMGNSVAAIMYIRLMQSSGADALLEYTGTKDSKYLQKAQTFAADYGATGLVFIQVNPLTPIPTAVLVVAGMLAKMNPVTVFSSLMISKYVMLLLNNVVISYASEGKTLEELLRSQLKGGAEEKAGDDSEDKKEQ